VCSRLLECVAVCCSVMQSVAVWCSVMQRVAVRGSVLECVGVCWSVLHYVAVWYSVLQCVAFCCSVLQCIAVWCSVMQCAAVCCSVLQCVVVCYWRPSFDESLPLDPLHRGLSWINKETTKTTNTAMEFASKFILKWSFFDQTQQPLEHCRVFWENSSGSVQCTIPIQILFFSWS